MRLAGRKFGAGVAETVARLLARIGDPNRLQDICEWIVDCDSEFLARIKGTG